MNEISYVLQHLDLVIDTSGFSTEMIYTEVWEGENSIVFMSNSSQMQPKTIQDIPILFCSNHKDFFTINEKGNLIFHHDLLKSAFYLLSGYDEVFVNKERDSWGRVTYQGSIQKHLKIIKRPLVNEYFAVIVTGLNEFYNFHKKPLLQKKKLFSPFSLLLSHDIDVIDKYGWPHLGFKIKELLGLARTNHSKWKILKATVQSALQFVNPIRSNPYWNFDFLTSIENEFNIHASYYFLSRDKEGGSNYSFDEKRLKHLFKSLIQKNHEIGIHGTTRTSTHQASLTDEIQELAKKSTSAIFGGRQHRLWLKVPDTFRIHQNCGLKYDSSFGFAEQEGFRNSFCLPFKPYDFDRQQAIDCWQFPLMAMDVTLFSYRKLGLKDIKVTINEILDQVEKHNGIFTLLWHNSFFDEILYPGVTQTYKGILKEATDRKGKWITGKELVNKLEESI